MSFRHAAVLLALIGVMSCARGKPSQPDPFERIPDTWIDLPGAPFVARLVGPKAILLNQSNETFDEVVVGCVRDDGGKALIVIALIGTQIFDSQWRPREHVEGLLGSINRRLTPKYQERYRAQPDAMKQCPANAPGIALVSASMRGVQLWSASGARWPQSR